MAQGFWKGNRTNRFDGSCGEPSSFLQWTLFLSFRAAEKETVGRGRVFSTHSLCPELSKALTGDPRRARLTHTLPAHVSARPGQSALGSETQSGQQLDGSPSSVRAQHPLGCFGETPSLGRSHSAGGLGQYVLNLPIRSLCGEAHREPRRALFTWYFQGSSFERSDI